MCNGQERCILWGSASAAAVGLRAKFHVCFLPNTLAKSVPWARVASILARAWKQESYQYQAVVCMHDTLSCTSPGWIPVTVHRIDPVDSWQGARTTWKGFPLASEAPLFPSLFAVTIQQQKEFFFRYLMRNSVTTLTTVLKQHEISVVRPRLKIQAFLDFFC
jgi:hypothetical protein